MVNFKGKLNPNYRHGFSQKKRHPLYQAWRDIKKRCNSITRRDSRWYSLKGIRVCAEWESAFIPFCKWALANGWKPGLTIDRIDATKGYCPSNCQWITFKANIQKAIKYKMVTAFGETKRLLDWPKDPRCKVTFRGLQARIHKGMDPEIALSFRRIVKDKFYYE